MIGELKSGQKLLVRVYDPPVFLRLINTFNHDQAKELLNGIIAWWLYDRNTYARKTIKAM